MGARSAATLCASPEGAATTPPPAPPGPPRWVCNITLCTRTTPWRRGGRAGGSGGEVEATRFTGAARARPPPSRLVTPTRDPSTLAHPGPSQFGVLRVLQGGLNGRDAGAHRGAARHRVRQRRVRARVPPQQGHRVQHGPPHLGGGWDGVAAAGTGRGWWACPQHPARSSVANPPPIPAWESAFFWVNPRAPSRPSSWRTSSRPPSAEPNSRYSAATPASATHAAASRLRWVGGAGWGVGGMVICGEGCGRKGSPPPCHASAP